MPKDYQEDDETKKLLKEVQERREQQERDIANDANRLNYQKVQHLMMHPSSMQHEVEKKMESEAEKTIDASDRTISKDVPKNRETGKILSDDREPGVSTHLHKHNDGVTISVKDQNTGEVERYNFNTGEGYKKNASDMTPEEQQRRMRSEHTQDNPNPDRDTIPGFHSSTWTKPEFPKRDTQNEE
ncbi:MAG: hypothetical protein J0M33_29650 [Anaerolineae bacterium]|nr:hypothetical protein [Anaerolineae bacterium]